MHYARIADGVVVNTIWLLDVNAADFPGAVKLDDRPVGIGDTYDGVNFYRNGEKILTPLEEAQAMIAELDAAIISLEYQNILLELEVSE